MSPLSLRIALCSAMVCVQVAASSALARRYPLSSLEALHGLIVSGLFEDSRGYIWVAAHRGVWRGQNTGFEPLATGNGSLAGARCFTEAPEGTLWIGTDHGLFALDLDDLTTISLPAQADRFKVRSLLRVSDERLMVGTASGLFELDPRHPARTPAPLAGAGTAVIFNMTQAASGDLWLATDTAIVRLTPGGTFERHFEDIVGRGPNTVVCSEDGALWFGLRHGPGLYRYHNETLRQYGPADGLLNDQVNALLQAPDGTLWIGTEDGAFYLRDGRFGRLHRAEGLRNTDIHAMRVDHEEYLWLGTFGSGVYQLRSLDVQMYHVEDGLPHPLVHDAHLLGDGRLLLSTVSGAAILQEGRPIEVIDRRQVERATVDRDGRVWLVDPHSVWRVGDPQHRELDFRIQALAPRAAGGVLIGGGQGFVSYDGIDTAALQLPKPVGRNVRVLRSDGDGHWLVGTRRGLARWHETSGQASVLVQDHDVTATGRHPDGTVWVGTPQGLFQLADGALQPTVPESMTIDQVLDIAFQPNGTVWAASGSGLLRYQDGALHLFRSADGLPSSDSRCLALDSARNVLFVGSSEGVARVDPRHLHPPWGAPRVAIRDWNAGKVSGWSRAADFDVPYGHAGIHVRVHSLGWRSRNNVQFEYLLDGRDANWSLPTSRSQYHITDLAPGDYTLRARAVNAHGRRSDREAALSFTVLPPWWLSRTFTLGCAAVFFMALYVVMSRRRHRRRSEALRQRHQERESRMKERMQQSQKLEAIGTLAAGVAHDMNNLLTAILGYKDMAASDPQQSAGIRDALEGIEAVASQGSDVVQSLLAFSRRRQRLGGEVELNELLRRTARMLKPILPAAIELRMDLAGRPLWVRAEPALLGQVFVNLAVNARDAMPNGGALTLSIRDMGDDARAATCAVTDEGVGMSAEVQERVFDPFFTTKARELGTGLGLAVVHGIIQDLGGTIRLGSEPGRGTRVEFKLPCCDPPAPAQQPAPIVVHGTTDKLLIMLAEDNPELSDMIVWHLEQAGHRALRAADGAELQLLATRAAVPPDLLIVDVDLPKTDGLTCLRLLRERWPNIPAVIITGSLNPLRLDLDERTRLLRKPFRMEALLGEVGSFARSHENGSAARQAPGPSSDPDTAAPPRRVTRTTPARPR